MNALTAERVERSFSRSFRSYHDTAGQQAQIAEKLVKDLVRLGAPRRFVNGFEIGCGTGHLTKALRGRFEFGRLTVNDLMPDSRSTAADYGATFVAGDARCIDWPAAPDRHGVRF